MAKLSLTNVAAGYNLVATYNANNDLIEAAIENSISRDGTAPNTMSADLDLNDNNISNVATPTNASHAANKSYVDAQIAALGTTGSGFNEALAYTMTNTFTIADALGTDNIAISHDGTDANFDFTNTTDLNLNDGVKLKVWDSSNTYSNDIYTVSDDLYIANPAVAGAVYLSGSDIVFKDQAGDSVARFIDGLTYIEGSILEEERAAAVVDLAGYGQIWIKDDTPNNLYFTDDTGQDVAITANGELATTARITALEAAVPTTGTFDTDWAGFSTAQSSTWTYRVSGNIVTIFCDQFGATSDATTFVSGVTDVPAALRPATTQMGAYITRDNGTFVSGTINISAAGRISFGAANLVGTGGFTASGDKGIRGPQPFTYTLD